MKFKRFSAGPILPVIIALCLAFPAMAAPPPVPYWPVPTPQQLQWEELELTGFLHFTVNTFTDREWGNGNESESVFNPTDFDADQIVRSAKEGGLRGLVLTCKHHDGFCLWPSKYTEHSVKNSPWKNGQGDVVKEISNACHKYGLKFGIYLSPWDRNNASYGRPEYITYYRNQLRELLTNYGPIFEVWLDGANGGNGYYGGTNLQNRVIDARTYYDWPGAWEMVRKLQPGAVIKMDSGPDGRWMGNEDGIAGETCWATLNISQWLQASNLDYAHLNIGDRPGTDWSPAECDVSIRPGWFYHASEDAKVKTPAQLLDIYYKSIGRGAELILNIPPDRRGQIHENDAQSLHEFKRIVDETFAHDLATQAKVTASNTRGNDQRFAPGNVTDGKRFTYWSTDNAETNTELMLDLGKLETFNVVRLREYLPLGQRVDTFALDQWQDGQWAEFASGTSIGNCRLIRHAPVTTTQVRLRLTGPVSPAISEFGLYVEPAAK